MALAGWHQWLLFYLYEVATILLAIGGLFVWRQGRRLLGAIIVCAFVGHLLGNHLMQRSNSELAEAQQVHSSAALASQSYELGRVLSSVCFLVGSVSYVVLAWGRRNAPRSNV